MEFETILTEERDGVFIITFNRLEARNAINNLMTKELSDALDYWDKNDELRACVLTNNGHVFCAGSDLKELAEDAWEMPEGREKWGFAACTKRYFDKPLIAAVRGKALGGGVEIVAACDLAVASDESIFGLPEPRVGLTAAGGGTLLRLAQQIPMKFAMELLLVAEPISAQKANEWGLVNYVVPDDQVVDKAVELAKKIALGAPLSIKYSKKTVIESFGSNFIYPSPGWEVLEEYEKITRRERRRPRRRGRIRRKAQACLDRSLTDERQPMSHEQSVPHIHSNENESRSHDRSSSLEDATLTRASKLIPPCVISVIDLIESAGYETWLVGGFVRDLLLERPLHDFDLTTAAPWQQVKGALRCCGLRSA